MCRIYALEWLDGLIGVSFNSAKTNSNVTHDSNSIKLKARIEDEKSKIQDHLNRMVFSLNSKKKIQLLINQYHSGLIGLLDQALENQEKCPEKPEELKQLANNLVFCIDELLSFIRGRFLNYLSLDQQVPATYLLMATKDLIKMLGELRMNCEGKVVGSDNDTFDVLMQILYPLFNNCKEKHSLTFHDIFYLKELCEELEHLQFTKGGVDMYTPLDRLLIYLNFNCRCYIDNFIQRLAEKLNGYENISGKMEMLLSHFKSFKQLPHKPGTKFDIRNENVDVEINNWFAQEIFYLEKKSHYALVPLNAGLEAGIGKTTDAKKIVCNLSVDQLAILLRSLDDLRILVARSLSAIFKSIVPHLSTQFQGNLSYDSMRSKSYAIEERDKEIVIQTLEKMIKKIREY